MDSVAQFVACGPILVVALVQLSTSLVSGFVIARLLQVTLDSESRTRTRRALVIGIVLLGISFIGVLIMRDSVAVVCP